MFLNFGLLQNRGKLVYCESGSGSMFRIRTVPDPDSSGSRTLSSASVEPPVEENGEVWVVSTWTRRERRGQT